LDFLGASNSGVRVTRESALTWSAFYRAVNIISQGIGGLPLKVYQRGERYGREIKRHVPNHPVDLVLRVSPNEEQTPMRWKEYIGASMCLVGNSYNEIVRDDKQTGKLVALYPLHPERVTPRRNETTRVVEYEYNSGENPPQVFEPHRILHIPLFGDDIVGKSPVTLFRETIGLGLGAERHAGASIGNGVSPSGALTHPEHLEKEAHDRLREQFEKRHAGPHNAGRTLILEEGMAWSKIGVDAKDAQFIEQRTFQVDEIARIFGIPPHMLAENTRSTFSNIEHLAIEFVVHTLRPWLIRIEEEINRKLLPPDGEFYVKFTVDALLRGDIKARYEAYSVGRQWGWLSANDVREYEDLDPLEPDKGDIYLSPVNMIPAEKAGQVADKTAQTPKAGAPTASDETESSSIGPMRRLFRDAAGRLLNREIASLERIVARGENDAATDIAIGEFYDSFAADVRRILGPSWEAFAEYHGTETDSDYLTTRYIGDSRKAVLDAFRHGSRVELERLLAVWKQCRADRIMREHLEA
jgi:HK97 family phage portal protein